jgi:hypothetical protein
VFIWLTQLLLLSFVLVFQFSKESVEFGGETTPVSANEPLSEEIILTNKKLVKLKYRFDTAAVTNCELTVTPQEGAIAPGKQKKVRVAVRVKDPANISFRFPCFVGANEVQMLGIRIKCTTGVFGVDPTTIAVVNDNGFMVPEPLYLMKQALLIHDGLPAEGIFRLAGEVSSIAKCKAALNNKTFVPQAEDDVNAVATLIKVYFRELPEPLMQRIPVHILLSHADDRAEVLAAFNALPPGHIGLFTWLLDLLVMTTAHSKINKMTPQNLAICVAPNLYDGSSNDPMEGLVLSQKCVMFVITLLNWYAETKSEVAASPRAGGAATTSSPVVEADPFATVQGFAAAPIPNGTESDPFAASAPGFAPAPTFTQASPFGVAPPPVFAEHEAHAYIESAPIPAFGGNDQPSDEAIENGIEDYPPVAPDDNIGLPPPVAVPPPLAGGGVGDEAYGHPEVAAELQYDPPIDNQTEDPASMYEQQFAHSGSGAGWGAHDQLPPPLPSVEEEEAYYAEEANQGEAEDTPFD